MALNVQKDFWTGYGISDAKKKLANLVYRDHALFDHAYF